MRTKRNASDERVREIKTERARKEVRLWTGSKPVVKISVSRPRIRQVSRQSKPRQLRPEVTSITFFQSVLKDSHRMTDRQEYDDRKCSH